MPDYEPDDVRPNDTAHFLQEPVEQAVERKKQKANTLEALPILQDLLKRLEERIAFYDSVSSIDESVRTDPQAFLIAHNSNTMMVQVLTSEKEWIESLLEDAMPQPR